MTTPVPTIRIELDPASHEEDLQKAKAQAQAAQAQADGVEAQASAQVQTEQTQSQVPTETQPSSHRQDDQALPDQDPPAPTEEQQDQHTDKESSSAHSSPIVEPETVSTITNSATITPRRSVDHFSDGPADRSIADQKLP